MVQQFLGDFAFSTYLINELTLRQSVAPPKKCWAG